ncbi:hypothetical protein G7078_07525 [Sphingomonas sinipercae]|uniref:Uncharacterized protein n=1 Tax=Sphingomonas sinipercae TaxID=2714944 RepID=A0A6G7ZNZ6_9SPHN|nr:hypothetical protein [Sphingomonas sinipercae]QIL02648.1 hypothetical protein G7078_07525 [Sphingomonas sinipercae]
MADILFLMAVVLFAVLFAAAASVALIRYKPTWSKKRVIRSAALVLPVLILALCCASFLRISLMSAEQCGVDACGMGILAGLVLTTLAVVLVVPGLIGARLAYRRFGSDDDPW